MLLIDKLRRFFRLPLCAQVALIEALVLLAFGRAVVLVFPLQRFEWLLGQRHQIANIGDIELSRYAGAVARVQHALLAASPHTPWSSNCFAQAIAGKLMLRRRRVPSTIYLGIRRKGCQNLEAHAWLNAGETTVCGGTETAPFSIIASYA